MTDLDPRVQRLSTAIAQVLVCLVEIAQAAPAPQEPELPLEEKPKAERKTRTAKPEAQEVVPLETAPAQTPVPETSSSKEETSSVVSAEKPSTDADLPEPTLDDAKALVLKVHGAKGRDAAVALLTSFGALFPEGHIKAGQPNAGALTPDQIAPFCEAAREVLEG